LYKELETAKNKLVGTKQVLRALAAGEVAVLYIAKDADNAIKEKILGAAGSNVQVIHAESMQALGECCGIDVRTACAAIKE
jgi:large subunit ribosomal protein L7A